MTTCQGTIYLTAMKIVRTTRMACHSRISVAIRPRELFQMRNLSSLPRRPLPLRAQWQQQGLESKRTRTCLSAGLGTSSRVLPWASAAGWPSGAWRRRGRCCGAATDQSTPCMSFSTISARWTCSRCSLGCSWGRFCPPTTPSCTPRAPPPELWGTTAPPPPPPSPPGPLSFCPEARVGCWRWWCLCARWRWRRDSARRGAGSRGCLTRTSCSSPPLPPG
mmetsp:Transcript_25489/g.48269  ORF Transcript_25489/g.48269 Transcript_25489/m.48269 type:complete len:220 (-) Transcript_25489:702-1361(-)